ncbi:MAG: alpha/beta fold hydrolase [Candidatus Kerfeldbacteria bacterium]|nr:alpha/beta fold hydrolase [Candidatus Kerfeldbacteria bacterium]
MTTERIEFITTDGVTIVGSWTPVTSAKQTALLLHMMPADRMSWQGLSAILARRTIASLAIDLRGHGESTQKTGQRLDYHAFRDADHQASHEDLAAAHIWLQGREVPIERTVLIGASIGANLALHDLAAHPALPAAVLLSPGLNYRGMTTADLVRRLAPSQSILLVASRDDAESATAVTELDRLTTSQRDVLLFDGAGHGTTMLERERFLGERIAEWLERQQ